ncbi:MAG TPA: hypothetical protein VFO76_01815 [Candidatus Kapabacteria bacterium]|nr:hypothetical protein [Candidatus Kapabacteria bacterium]
MVDFVSLLTDLYDSNTMPMPPTKDELTAAFWDRYEALGRQPKYSEMRPPAARYNFNEYRRAFGSWANFLKTVGMRSLSDIRRKDPVSKEDLTEAFWQTFRELGRQPTSTEMHRMLGDHKFKRYRVLFGNWSGFLATVNLKAWVHAKESKSAISKKKKKLNNGKA